MKVAFYKSPRFAYAGLIIYPINGRAAGLTPIGHYSFDRDSIIRMVAKELLEQEPRYAEKGIRMLKRNDVVRVGRIIVQIMRYDTRMPTTKGASVIKRRHVVENGS